MTICPGGPLTDPPGFFLRMVLVALLALLPACMTLFHSRTEQTLAMARAHGLMPTVLTQQGFSLLALVKKPTTPTRLLVVYVEGDGFAWQDRHHLSSDPTPKKPLVLGLMVQDRSPALLYLGRPCQYLEAAVETCLPQYWSSHRYAPEVVAAMSGAIDTVKQTMQAEQIMLVGYSGGGTIAALLAAKRQDVTGLITVAANLDVAAWTAHHQVSPMPHSWNPVDFAEGLAKIPQFHLVGEQDQQVPAAIVQTYVRHLPDPVAVMVQRVPDFDHDCCWVAAWPTWLAKVPFYTQ